MATTFLTLPIEIRHKIFAKVAEHPDGAIFYLKEWLETHDSTTSAKGVSINEHPVEVDYESDVEDQEGSDDEDEDEDWDGDGDGDEGEDEDQGDEEDNENDTGESIEEAESEINVAGVVANVLTEDLSGTAGEDMAEEAEVDVMDEDAGNSDADADDNTTPAATSDMTDAGAVHPNSVTSQAATDGAQAATAAPVQPTGPTHRTKYRHIVPILQLSGCPPPVNLLLICKQVRDEALEWYYAAATLSINVTKGFKHMSFFEESLNLLANAISSPLTQMRRAQLTYVWDSAYLRTDGDDFFNSSLVGNIFQLRASIVLSVLRAMPFLQKLAINWHDTEQSGDGVRLQQEILSALYEHNSEFGTEIDVSQHILESGKKFEKKSILGRFRMELKQIKADTTGYGFL